MERSQKKLREKYSMHSKNNQKYKQVKNKTQGKINQRDLSTTLEMGKKLPYFYTSNKFKSNFDNKIIFT